MAAGCQRDAAKLDGINEELIHVLNYLTYFVLFMPKPLLMN